MFQEHIVYGFTIRNKPDMRNCPSLRLILVVKNIINSLLRVLISSCEFLISYGEFVNSGGWNKNEMVIKKHVSWHLIKGLHK